MGPLDPALRKRLENAVREARRVGEDGAHAALGAIAVDAPRPHGSMSESERALRRKLRAHASEQLGDERNRDSGAQEIKRLGHEVAYEHWHRMLFARFLAENGLLIEPESRVAVSLEECGELAREGFGADGWAVAEAFAARMLPRIFRPDDPALAVTLAPETRQKLEKLVADLPKAVFTATDSLGWTYQFWQTDRKDEVNRSEVKIGSDELPAVTQLFTEPYMVRFLFHNTVGAWRAGRLLAERPELVRVAASEAELAEAVRVAPVGGVSGYDFEYLRFVRDPGEETDAEGDSAPAGPWRPAAGAFERWPARVADLRVLDPCCGSGHFLAEGFELITRLHMEEEGLGVEAAVRAVLRDNLFGLEIDQRCTQIAAFNVALAAWKMVGRPIVLPQPNIACSGLAVAASREEWLALTPSEQAARDLGYSPQQITGTLDRLHGLFRDAPMLGSLIDPKRVGGDDQQAEMYEAGYDAVAALLEDAFRREESGTDEGRGGSAAGCVAAGGVGEAVEDVRERGLTAAGISRAAALLAGEYDLVITNVPYLARRKQAAPLQEFADASHPDGKKELATMFVSRILGWLGERGTQAVVVQQNWLFLTSYRKLRERLLRERTWRLLARLGSGAFETISGEIVNVALIVLSAERSGDDGALTGIDVSALCGQRKITPREKAELLLLGGHQGRGPCRRGVAAMAEGSRTCAAEGGAAPVPSEAEADVEDTGLALSAVADRRPGVLVPSRQADQRGNPDSCILLRPLAGQVLLRQYAYGHQGIATADYACFGRKFWELPARGASWEFQQSTVRQTTENGGREHVLHWDDGEGPFNKAKAYVYRGRGAWSRDGIAVSQMGPLACTRYTGEYFDNNVAVLTVSEPDNLPAVWCFCASADYCEGIREFDHKLNVTNANLVKAAFELDHWQKVATRKYPNGLPEPYSDDPTQWLFHGHPCGSVIWDEGTKWTAHGQLRNDASVLQVAVARLLGYRWPAELDAEMRLAAESREWVRHCEELHDFAEEDGIVCLNAVAGEPPAADRLRRLLAAAYGEEWSPAKERELLAAAAAAANKKTPAASLEEWLRDAFFAEHMKLFHNRPFVWHVWDGRKDGFHALVNCHRLCGPDGEGRRTLQALAYRHLGEWTLRQRAAQAVDEEGADARLAAAQDLLDQLEHILEGEPPCDIFIRWRALGDQPIGWEPNLDDGVRLNIRPFLRAELQSGGLKGAGILRVKPNVKWNKDRGKEPESLRPREDFPWFWSCPGQGSEADRTDYAAPPEAAYDGSRWNDLHHTRAVKDAARTVRNQEGGG